MAAFLGVALLGVLPGILIAILLFRPAGLLGKLKVEKV